MTAVETSARSRSRSPRRPPPTPGYFRPPDSPCDAEGGEKRVSFGLPPGTPDDAPAGERRRSKSPRRLKTPPVNPQGSPTWYGLSSPSYTSAFAGSSFTPPPQTPLSPGAEQELARLAQGLGNVRTRGALVLARCLVSSVLAAVEELRVMRRAQLRAERLKASEQPSLDMGRIAEMMAGVEAGDDEGGDAPEAPPEPVEATVDPSACTRVQKLLALLGQEIAGPSTQAQLSISGAGKEVAWFMNHFGDGATCEQAQALVQRWKKDVAGGKSPVTVALLATELEQALFQQATRDTPDARSHKQYYARVRELAGSLRHAQQARQDLLCRQVFALDVAGWEKEMFWSPSRRARVAADAAKAAKQVTVAVDADHSIFHDPALKCPGCGTQGATCTVLSEYSGVDGGRRFRAKCDRCSHEWAGEN